MTTKTIIIECSECKTEFNVTPSYAIDMIKVSGVCEKTGKPMHYILKGANQNVVS